MKKRWIAVLLLVLSLLLCGCASGEQETNGGLTAEPSVTEESAPAETEAPAPAETEPPAPAETVLPAPAETELPAPEETETSDLAAATEPHSEEERIKLTERWQLAYQALLEDPELLDQVIGEAGDYRKGYFGGWDNPDYRLPFSSYAAADLDGDGTPELLLDSDEMGLTDLIGWNGDYVYIGYDDYLGFLPELGAALVHGHWHGAGGSYLYEYSVSRLPEHELLAYFDHSEPGYGEVLWSFLEEGSQWYSGSQDGDSRRYDAMIEKYVTPALRLEDLDFTPLDSLRGLAEPQELQDLPSIGEIGERFPAACRRFLEEKGWKSLGLELKEETLEAALRDLDRDGVQELLLQDRAHSFLFRYDGGKDQMVLLGQVKGEIVGGLGQDLAARDGENWFVYSKRRSDLRETQLDSFSEENTSMISWSLPEELAASLF